ncbi:E3 ubiquitin-protein ligase TRIM39 [Microcaecilia unicolor]|uniref:E3 ubiquitin-protein ligase TRIM39-like n=1 Tax=Microcaecilia unicolor TaxID=1415580 RepID=A0A6P7X6K6_9AMPH|nr:E3 ubiquitin-protein ligase TRIM39-like [Microcaecilia unicolor]
MTHMYQDTKISERENPITDGEAHFFFFCLVNKKNQEMRETETFLYFPVRSMAAGNCLQNEAFCSLCLDYFTDPVTLDCGHNFCCSCITQSWNGLEENFPCPQCGSTFQQKKLRRNRQLANVIYLLKKLLKPVRKRKRKNQCNKHEEKVKLLKSGPKRKRKNRCKKHEEKLKLFCSEDGKPVCVVCSKSRDHRLHSFIPIEEAVEKYKEKYTNCLKPLKEKLEEIQIFTSNEEMKADQLKSETKVKRQKIVSEFQELHQCLNNEEQILLSRLEEEEKAILQKINENVKQIQQQSFSLKLLISGIEKKCHLSATAFLKDVEDDISRCLTVEIPKPETVSVEGKMYLQLSYPRQNIILKKLNTKFGQCWMEHGRYAVNVTLDPETAHPELILSEDWKNVRRGEKRQDLPDNLKRFDTHICILASESFSSGRHYWEVEVGDKTGWGLGICKDSVSRKGGITPSPENGYWVLWLRDGDKYWASTSPWSRLFLMRPQAVGIFLDYEAGKVSFYNADTKSHLFTFNDTFTEKLRPYFNPFLKYGDKSAGTLKIRPVSDWD